MISSSINPITISCAIALCLMQAVSWTSHADSLTNDSLSMHTPLTDHELSSLRGGFITTQGVEITIGYEQLVYMDNQLESALNVDLSGLINAPNGQLPGFGQLFRMNVLPQGGRAPDTRAVLGSDLAGYLTLIQNSLNDKTIHNINVLDVGVKNVGSFQSRGLSQLLDHQLTQAVR